MKARQTARYLFLFLLAVVAFYWKLLFTNQFSLLSSYEGANVTYAWFHYSLANLKRGVFPLWNPYTHSGQSFIGEIQTQAFGPLKLLLAALPFDQQGLFSPKVYNLAAVLTHFLAGCLMFALVRHLRLSRFPALLAAVCFSLGGFIGHQGPWSHILNSAVWLPLLFLLTLKALEAARRVQSLLFAWLAGVTLAVSTFSGGFHIVVMQVLALISLIVFWYSQRSRQEASLRIIHLLRCAAVLAAIGVVTFCTAAVQLLPSLEYSPLAYRYLGEPMLPATQKIPYAYLSTGCWPQALFGFLFGFPFDGNIGAAEGFTPYLGALPFLFVLLAIYRSWHKRWVRYLFGLALVSFFYTLGEFSFLHGLMYATFPVIWMAREAPRALYLTHFAMAILCAYGAEAFFQDLREDARVARFVKVCTWSVAVLAAGLALPAMWGTPRVGLWTFESFLFVLASFALFRHIARTPWTAFTQFLAIGLLLCDLGSFNWTAENRIALQKTGKDHLEVLRSFKDAAHFLKSRPGLFRVQLSVPDEPNVGDVYSIQTTGGMANTTLKDYRDFTTLPNFNPSDLLNVRYFVEPRTSNRLGAVYEDAAWKVYENPGCYPRAWLVCDARVIPGRNETLAALTAPGFDPRRTALVNEPLETVLSGTSGSGEANVRVESYEAGEIRLRTMTTNPALLVLSEVYYPGWQAEVNGASARIHKVDGLLRGVAVPPGENVIRFRYQPRSVLVGALLTLSSLLGLMSVALIWHFKTRTAACEAQPVAHRLPKATARTPAAELAST